MKILHRLITLFFALTTISCGNSSTEEYFCELKQFGSKNSSALYFQSSVKVSDKQMCLYHRGEEYCSKYGEKVNGFIDKSDWDKNILHSENYITSHVDDNYIFKIFDKYQLQQGVDVETRLVDGEWHFTFDGKELKPTLSNKFATDEAMLIFKIASIENRVNGNINGFFVSRLSPKKSTKIKEDTFDSLFEVNKEILFYYGNEKYNEIKSYVNGNYLNDTYTFNKSKLSLTSTPTHPFILDGSDGIYRYKCQKWIKQKWYEFP
jgi:hypothetical protein